MDKKIQKRSQQTRDRILDVTRDLFAQHGRDNVSTDMIAAKANVAKGTIFAHFTDRANLVAAVTLQDLDEMIRQIEMTGRTLSGQDWIFAAYHSLLDQFGTNPDVARTFVEQSLSGTGEWSARFNRKCLDFEDLLRVQLVKGFPDQQIDILLGGAQAFFLQIVVYRDAEWITAAQAKSRLDAYLSRWFSLP